MAGKQRKHPARMQGSIDSLGHWRHPDFFGFIENLG
jgi:hypothetical protein